jgi:hypothetical protein
MSKPLRAGLRLLALIGGLLIAAACSDSNNDDDDDGEPTAVETMEGDEATPPDGEGDGDGDGDGDGSTFSDFADEFGDQEMVVTYEFTSSVDGSAGSFTIFWKPPDRWRFDVTSDEGTATFLQTPDGVYICSDDGSGGGCFLSPGGASAVPFPFLSYFTDPTSLEGLLASAEGVDLDSSSDNIAGVDATCYSGSTEEGSGQVCFGSDNGILLRIRGSDTTTGDFTMEATSVETSVDDADLEPPYPVQEIPGL